MSKIKDIRQSIDQRNPTMNTPVGPIPRPKTPQGVHKQEKKNLKTRGYTGTGYSGSLMGGSSSSTFTNTSAIRREQRTFGEFMSLAEGKKNKNEPPNAVPGTYHETGDGSKTYILKPAKPLKKPLSKKEIFKQLEKQGGIGGKAIRKAQKQQEGFSYGSKEYQQQLEKKRKEAEERRRQEAEQRREQLYRERTSGRGIRAVHKGQSGWMKNGKFTADEDS